mgnify:CR=1 FL=1
MRKIPIGIQDFKKLRDEDYYYVDKSDLIAQILDGGAEVYLFTRPRRFGKSLNLSMLDAFLNVKHKGNTWFDGLRVSERKDLEPRKNASPFYTSISKGSRQDPTRISSRIWVW